MRRRQWTVGRRLLLVTVNGSGQQPYLAPPCPPCVRALPFSHLWPLGAYFPFLPPVSGSHSLPTDSESNLRLALRFLTRFDDEGSPSCKLLLKFIHSNNTNLSVTAISTPVFEHHRQANSDIHRSMLFWTTPCSPQPSYIVL